MSEPPPPPLGYKSLTILNSKRQCISRKSETIIIRDVDKLCSIISVRSYFTYDFGLASKSPSSATFLYIIDHTSDITTIPHLLNEEHAHSIML